MAASRHHALGALWLAVLVVVRPALGQTVDTAAPPATAARNRVVLRVLGDLSDAERAGLTALLQADFRRRALALSVNVDGGDRRRFIDAQRAEPSTLLIAVLDVQSRSSWQLSIVDAARGRAIVRALPGGVDANAAALEAVASIVSSAASALSDGLEVASQSIDEVMSPETPSADRALAPRATPSPVAPEPRFGVRSSLAVVVASFAPEQALTAGFSAELGFGWGAFTPRLSGTRYLSSELSSPFGNFSVGRTAFGLSLGRTFGWDKLELEPEAALRLELLRRSGAQSTSQVAASGDSSLHRFGGLLGLRLRYRFSGHVALEWAAGGFWFPERVRFLAATPQPSELAGLWRWGATSQLGLEVRAP